MAADSDARPTPGGTQAFTVEESEAGTRLDRFLDARFPDASRARVQRWIDAGAVRVNGEPARKSRALEPDDTVTVDAPETPPAGTVVPQDIPLDIVYEDPYLVVVHKPKGLVTHPGHGVPDGTLANALAHHYGRLSNHGGDDRPGIVHRLDRDTSGLLVAARDNDTHAQLSTMLAERRIHRTYQAIVWREPAPEGTLDGALGRHPKDPTRRAVIAPHPRAPASKHAVTHWRVLDWYQFAAHVEVRLETGRTHQIRVHFAHAGHPVAGDTLYGGDAAILGRVAPLFQGPAAGLLKRLHSQALHAARLQFTHPRTGAEIDLSAPPPEEFRAALAHLKPFRRPDAEQPPAPL